MIVDGFQGFARTRNSFNYVRAFANRPLHFGDVTDSQLVLLRADMFASDAFTAEGLLDNLQIRHARDNQVREAAGRPENGLQHRNSVILERAETFSPHQRAVEIPKKNA